MVRPCCTLSSPLSNSDPLLIRGGFCSVLHIAMQDREDGEGGSGRDCQLGGGRSGQMKKWLPAEMTGNDVPVEGPTAER
jgi:hypothetical protein